MELKVCKKLDDFQQKNNNMVSKSDQLLSTCL